MERLSKYNLEGALAKLTLPLTIHDESQFRIWQRRFCDMNIRSEERYSQKLNYIYGNPVQ
jgi:hypothetical protein